MDAIARFKCYADAKVGRFAVRSRTMLPLKSIYSDRSNQWNACCAGIDAGKRS